ncbi:hypothetical protein B0H19DRAFT_1267005 [Mycena capillaripes]|nr:hypothetical protein B0H19DRAFT_1267005 [Mycena capillaripes]
MLYLHPWYATSISLTRESSFLNITRQFISLLESIPRTGLTQLILGVRLDWASSVLVHEDLDPAPFEDLARILDSPAYFALGKIRIAAPWDETWGFERTMISWDGEEVEDPSFDEVVGCHRREFTWMVVEELPASIARTIALVHEDCGDCS